MSKSNKLLREHSKLPRKYNFAMKQELEMSFIRFL